MTTLTIDDRLRRLAALHPLYKAADWTPTAVREAWASRLRYGTEPMRLRIVSDGTGPGTSIVDVDTGRYLAATKVSWSVEAGELAVVVIETDDFVQALLDGEVSP